MPKTKQCMYSLCQNNTYSAKPGSAIIFIPFPRPRKDAQKCKKWITACGRYDDRLNIEKVVKKSYYICEEHFVGGKGPTVEHPDPVPFEETTESLNLMNQSLGLQQIVPEINVSVTSNHLEGDLSVNSSHLEGDLSVNSSNLEGDLSVNSSHLEGDLSVNSSLLEGLSVTSSHLEGDLSVTLSNSSGAVDDVIIKSEGSDHMVCMPEVTISPSKELKNITNTYLILENQDNTLPVVASPNTAFSKLVNIQTLSGKPVPNNWTLLVTEEGIAFTKQNIEKGLITKSFTLKDLEIRGVLKINGKLVNSNHPLVNALPDVTNVDALFEILITVDEYPICSGINQQELINNFKVKEKTEGYINLCDDSLHSSSCEIVQSHQKKQNKINLATKDLCAFCTSYRRVLINSITRQEKISRSNCGEKRHQYLQRDVLIKKLKTETQRTADLRKRIRRVKSKMRKDVKKSGEYF